MLPAVGSEPDPADEDTRNPTNCSGFAFDKPCASRGAKNSASSSLNTLIGLLLPPADILMDPCRTSLLCTPFMIFNIVIWSITAGWLASKVQSITSSRKTLPFPFCAIFEVEEHPVVSEARTRQQQSIGAMARVTEEKMVIPVLLCQKQAGKTANRQTDNGKKPYQIPKPIRVILSASHPNSPIAMMVSRLRVGVSRS